jgi:hypothetical protein
MKKFVCDICDVDQEDNFKLLEIADKYKSIGINDICFKCNTQIAAVITKIEAVLDRCKQNWVRELLRAKKLDIK